MLDTFGFPTPQNANYQEFFGGGTTRDWIKPRGASMVRIMLIGGGGGGRSGNTSAAGAGGGSGAVNQWIGPAIFIPDVLRVTVGAGGASDLTGGTTSIVYQQKNTAGYTLISANGGSATGGTVYPGSPFATSGIFSSTIGQNGGAAGGNVGASGTTFLSGGAGGGNATTDAGRQVTPNYSYPIVTGGAGTTGGNGNDGYFITQPLFLGCGGAGGGGSTTAAGGVGGRGGIGCGGGGGGRCTTGTSLGGRGGDGAVFIWSW